MRFLRKWVFNNWGLKLLALAFSLLLWTTYMAEPVSEVGYLVPLEFSGISGNLEISGDPPTQVQVRVRGRSALLRRLSRADLSIDVDLAGHGASETLIHLTPDLVAAPFGVTVVRINPSQVRVLLVPRREPR
ncbi:MAG TPA: CdaR family protein [Candidatus Acidoferrales bacterium]|nr:CdaR family protein [Candidatus Acidoferrales bacterium]